MIFDALSIPVDLYIDQGTTYSKVLIVKNLNGSVSDLTGLSITSKYFPYSGSFESYMIQSTISNAAAGEITLTISSGMTGDMIKSRYFYDIRLRLGSEVREAFHGQIVVRGSSV